MVVSVKLLFCMMLSVSLAEGFAPLFSTKQSTPSVSDQPSSSNEKPLTLEYTHLEINGMILKVPETELSIVIDPIASQLDFGIPWGYRANKKVLSEQDTLHAIIEAAPTHCLLSMGLDDHTHLPTLRKLIQALPNLNFVVAPSAYTKIASVLLDASKIRVLRPGQSLALVPSVVDLTATEGALVGPPWQARENGWLIQFPLKNRAVYYEPHADTTDESLRGVQADIVISPVKEQSLPAQVPKAGQFTLVYGGTRTLEIAKILKASVVVPLANGELNVEGPLSSLVEASGSVEEFEELVDLQNRGKQEGFLRVERSTPGTPLKIQL